MKSFITVFLLMVSVASIHLASAQPVSLPPPELVNAVFDEMALTVLSFNFPDVPADLAKLSPRQLASCVSPQQRSLVRACASQVDKEKPIKEGVPIVVDCVLNGIEAYDPTSDSVNARNLKEGMIDMSLLTPDQKKAARESVDSCLESTFPLPPDAVTNKKSTSAKAMICAMKALGINGCAEKATELARMARSFAAEDDTEESNENLGVVKRVKRMRKKSGERRGGGGGRSREKHRGKHSKERHSHEKHKHSHEKDSHEKDSHETDDETTTTRRSTTASTTTTTPSTTTTSTTPSTTTTQSTTTPTTTSSKRPTRTTKTTTTERPDENEKDDEEESAEATSTRRPTTKKKKTTTTTTQRPEEDYEEEEETPSDS